MKRRNRFLTVLLSAAFSFSILTVAVGTDHWKRGYYWQPGYHYHHHDCDEALPSDTGQDRSLES